MIQIYRRNEAGKNRYIGYVESYDDMFLRFYESDIEAFGYSELDRTKKGWLFDDCPVSPWLERDLVRMGWLNHYCYTVYEDGKFITPDRLVGFYREFRIKRAASWDRKWRQRRSRNKAYGGHRRVRTFQERKMACAQDEEYFIKVRPSRNTANMVEPWDDIIAHNDKSWKTQSKRKKQWKE